MGLGVVPQIKDKHMHVCVANSNVGVRVRGTSELFESFRCGALAIYAF